LIRDVVGIARVETFRRALQRAQSAANAISGKVGIVGFALGGGTALFRAANMPELGSVAIYGMQYEPGFASQGVTHGNV
jgi:dienelactone hydrolase